MFVVVAVSAGLTEALSVLERVNSVSVLVCSICRSDLSVVCLRKSRQHVCVDRFAKCAGPTEMCSVLESAVCLFWLQCLQVRLKRCRCGQSQKEVLCSKEYLCEKRCTNLRDCGKHQCKRKVGCMKCT